jgi:2-(1,2-epoxy-1,2-dihydrophenyl)acetyl-CoA isomerase
MSKKAGKHAVELEIRGGLTILRLNQPESMNALSREMKDKLAEYVPQFIDDADARCLLITGSGNSFCAGGDLKSIVGPQSPQAVRDRLSGSHERWVKHLLQGRKPVVTAVNGAAVGAGFALAMLGDIILASDDAYFIAGFANVGAAADLALAMTLPRAIGMTRAKELLLLNERVSAQQALSMGMINRVSASGDLLDAAVGVGEKLAAGPTVGLGLTKMLMNKGFEEPLSHFFDSEIAAQVAAFATSDFSEGLAAFESKRRPSFKGH